MIDPLVSILFLNVVRKMKRLFSICRKNFIYTVLNDMKSWNVKHWHISFESHRSPYFVKCYINIFANIWFSSSGRTSPSLLYNNHLGVVSKVSLINLDILSQFYYYSLFQSINMHFNNWMIFSEDGLYIVTFRVDVSWSASAINFIYFLQFHNIARGVSYTEIILFHII